MALTLEDLAARVEELEQELIALRSAQATPPPHVTDTPGTHATSARAARIAPQTQGEHDAAVSGQQHRTARRALRRPISRLGLMAAAAAGAYAVMPGRAFAETQAVPGDAVTPSAQIISPNGQYQLDVVNTGIFLKGPTGGIELTGGQIKIASSAAVTILAAATLTVNGAVVKLGSGALPVARQGDAVVNGQIVGGNPTVLA